MAGIYDPRSLEYESVCETIGHLYLERCHYERESARILSKADDLSSQIADLNSEIDAYKQRIESHSAENEEATDAEDERP